jgi:hypothetical protein
MIRIRQLDRLKDRRTDGEMCLVYGTVVSRKLRLGRTNSSSLSHGDDMKDGGFRLSLSLLLLLTPSFQRLSEINMVGEKS